MVREGKLPFEFQDRPVRIGVLPRYATSADEIKWFSTGGWLMPQCSPSSAPMPLVRLPVQPSLFSLPPACILPNALTGEAPLLPLAGRPLTSPTATHLSHGACLTAAENFMAFHVANAWEEGSTIRLFLCCMKDFR